MTDRLAPFTQRVNRCARALELRGADAELYARTAGPPLKAEVVTAARAAFGADLKPWKGKAVKAGVGYDVAEISVGVRLEFKLRPAGVWAFGENGAKAHMIGTGRKKGVKRGAARYVKGAGYAHPVRAPIKHPGSAGKGAIRYAFKRVRKAQGAAVRAGVLAVWKDAQR